jgi:hypothetical protein
MGSAARRCGAYGGEFLWARTRDGRRLTKKTSQTRAKRSYKEQRQWLNQKPDQSSAPRSDSFNRRRVTWSACHVFQINFARHARPPLHRSISSIVDPGRKPPLLAGNSYTPPRVERTPRRTPLGGYGPAHRAVSGEGARGDRSPAMEKIAGKGPSRRPPLRRHEAADAAVSGGGGGASP